MSKENITNLPPIYFYIKNYQNIPQQILELEVVDAWQWQFQQSREDRKKIVSDGEFAWIVQTYLRLKQDNFPCQLTDTFPQAGIVLAHRDSLRYDIKPNSKTLIICVEGSQTSHPFAQFRVVHNQRELFQTAKSHNNWQGQTRISVAKGCHFIRHWPQPGIIPRDRDRGDRFENVAYFGTGANLASELLQPAWKEKLASLGLSWHFQRRGKPNGWMDYSYVDAVVAVRSFDEQDYTWKPASKLYNAWHAEVPAILGRESAFQDERKSDLDYLEVNSLDNLINTLIRLRDDKELYCSMVANGKIRAAETQPENLVTDWRNFLTKVAVPAYENWCNKSTISQQIFITRCQLTEKYNTLVNRMSINKKPIKT
jgi:hypothetical protein